MRDTRTPTIIPATAPAVIAGIEGDVSGDREGEAVGVVSLELWMDKTDTDASSVEDDDEAT